MTNRQPRLLSPRTQGAIIAVILGYFLLTQFEAARESYWLLKDGRQGMAVITRDLWTGHRGVAYRYQVNQRQYTGKGRRNSTDPRYINALPGSESVVYYSASHPWISALDFPRTMVEGLPVILIVMMLETIAVVTVIKPNSRWAFRTKQGNVPQNAAAPFPPKT